MNDTLDPPNSDEIADVDDSVSNAITDPTLEASIPESMHGTRLDQSLAQLFSQYSRSRLQQWIRAGHVAVDGKILRAKDKVMTGQKVSMQVQDTAEGEWQAEAIALDVVFEDEDMLIINKAAGMVVHPAAGNPSGTLLNALLHYAPELEAVPRAGIVHRLDKETSGVLVVARTLVAHKSLVEQLQARAFEREYIAVVNGVLTAGGTIDAPIGRHSQQRVKMAVVAHGRPAVTHYRVEQRFRGHSSVKVNLETGRTHQIRVHMAHAHHPIVGDPVYGGRFKLPAGCSESLIKELKGFRRQALHARYLGLVHPFSGEAMGWKVDVPDDLTHLLAVLGEDLRDG